MSCDWYPVAEARRSKLLPVNPVNAYAPSVPVVTEAPPSTCRVAPPRGEPFEAVTTPVMFVVVRCAGRAIVPASTIVPADSTKLCLTLS